MKLTLRQRIQVAISDLRIEEERTRLDSDVAAKLDHNAHCVVCTAVIKQIKSQIKVLEDIL